MPALTTRWAATRIGNYDATELGVLLVNEDGAAAAATTMEFVADVTTDELAGSYARGLILMELTEDGDTHILDFDPATDPYTTDTTGQTPAGAWFYDTTGANDAAHRLLFFLPLAAGDGYADWQLLQPADGAGCVRVRVVDDELVAAVIAAIDIIDGGTES